MYTVSELSRWTTTFCASMSCFVTLLISFVLHLLFLVVTCTNFRDVLLLASLLRRYFCNDRTRYRRKDDNTTITGGLGSVMWLLEIVSKFYSVEFKGAEPLLQLLPTILWNLFLPIYVYSLNEPRMNNGCSGKHYSLSWLREAMQNRWIREGKDLGKMIWTRNRRNSNARLERINVVGQMLIWLQVIRLLFVHSKYKTDIQRQLFLFTFLILVKITSTIMLIYIVMYITNTKQFI